MDLPIEQANEFHPIIKFTAEISDAVTFLDTLFFLAVHSSIFSRKVVRRSSALRYGRPSSVPAKALDPDDLTKKIQTENRGL